MKDIEAIARVLEICEQSICAADFTDKERREAQAKALKEAGYENTKDLKTEREWRLGYGTGFEIGTSEENTRCANVVIKILPCYAGCVSCKKNMLKEIGDK